MQTDGVGLVSQGRPHYHQLQVFTLPTCSKGDFEHAPK
jgi:hypothetical protein